MRFGRSRLLDSVNSGQPNFISPPYRMDSITRRWKESTASRRAFTAALDSLNAQVESHG